MTIICNCHTSFIPRTQGGCWPRRGELSVVVNAYTLPAFAGLATMADRRPERSRPLRPGHSRSRRQQRRDRRVLRRPRHGGTCDPVLGRRYRRAALHLAPAADRSSFDPRRPDKSARQGLRQPAIGNPRQAGTLVGPLISWRARAHVCRAGARQERGRPRSRRRLCDARDR